MFSTRDQAPLVHLSLNIFDGARPVLFAPQEVPESSEIFPSSRRRQAF